MAARLVLNVTANTGVGEYAGSVQTPSNSDYVLAQFEAETTADVEVYGRVHSSASWALLDTVSLVADTPVINSYFNAGEWAFRVTNIGAAQSVKVFMQNGL